MATKTGYRLNISYLMTNVNPKSKRPVVATFSTRIKDVAAQAYINAADDAARAATTVGQLIHFTNQLSLGTPQTWGVNFAVKEDTAVAPPDGTFAYSFDKFAAAMIASGVNSQITIPGRDMSVITLESDGVTVVTGGAIPDDWINAMQGIALDEDGHSPTIERIFVVR